VSKRTDVPLHIVGESREGLVVSGARMLATLALRGRADGVFASRTHPTDAPVRFAFAIPIAVPGLGFICRASMPAARLALPTHGPLR
jgi:4-hydroxyphenylacetate 3-monooxygenase